MNFETSLTFTFTQLANNFRYKFDLKMKEIDLNGGQVFILISLWNNDRQSQIDLAAKLNLSAPTVNKMVKSLIANGFVECFKCRNDGRIMQVHLTPKGIDYQTRVEQKWIEFETGFFSDLTDTEKLILTQIFGKLRENSIKKEVSSKTNIQRI
jgi:DNA-binding MarR family transcriptional regulator